jgi:hypothetical protein
VGESFWKFLCGTGEISGYLVGVRNLGVAKFGWGAKFKISGLLMESAIPVSCCMCGLPNLDREQNSKISVLLMESDCACGRLFFETRNSQEGKNPETATNTARRETRDRQKGQPRQ